MSDNQSYSGKHHHHHHLGVKKNKHAESTGEYRNRQRKRIKREKMISKVSFWMLVIVALMVMGAVVFAYYLDR